MEDVQLYLVVALILALVAPAVVYTLHVVVRSQCIVDNQSPVVIVEQLAAEGVRVPEVKVPEVRVSVSEGRV